MPLVSRTEAALLLGVTPDAVYKAIKAGRLSTKTNSLGEIVVDSDTMREEWLRNTDTRRSRVGQGVRPTMNKDKPLRDAKERMAERIGATKETIPDYDESRARTEYLKAELLELDRQTKEGRLVPAADVESKWVEIVVQARTKLLGIPTKAKQRIPDLDVDAINTLDDIVRETLEELAANAQDEEEQE